MLNRNVKTSQWMHPAEHKQFNFCTGKLKPDVELLKFLLKNDANFLDFLFLID